MSPTGPPLVVGAEITYELSNVHANTVYDAVHAAGRPNWFLRP